MRRGPGSQHRVDLLFRHGGAQQEFLIADARFEIAPQFSGRWRWRFIGQFNRTWAIKNAIQYIRLNGGAGSTKLAQHITNDLIRDGGIAFTTNQVVQRLRANHLRERRHHDGISQLRTHLYHFTQQISESMFQLEFGKLAPRRADDATR